MTLVSVDKKGNDTIATIGIVTKYTYDDNDGNNKMELEGTIERSIKNYDFFKIEIRKYYENQLDTNAVEFYLADFRFEADSSDYIVSDWRWVDLSNLGFYVMYVSTNWLWVASDQTFEHDRFGLDFALNKPR